MRDIYHSSHEYNIKCYLFPKTMYKANNILSADKSKAQVFYARYVGTRGQAANQASGTMQYISKTFSIETLDEFKMAINDFVLIKGNVCVIETIRDVPVQHTQEFGKPSFSYVLELRR